MTFAELFKDIIETIFLIFILILIPAPALLMLRLLMSKLRYYCLTVSWFLMSYFSMLYLLTSDLKIERGERVIGKKLLFLFIVPVLLTLLPSKLLVHAIPSAISLFLFLESRYIPLLLCSIGVAVGYFNVNLGVQILCLSALVAFSELISKKIKFILPLLLLHPYLYFSGCLLIFVYSLFARGNIKEVYMILPKISFITVPLIGLFPIFPLEEVRIASQIFAWITIANILLFKAFDISRRILGSSVNISRFSKAIILLAISILFVVISSIFAKDLLMLSFIIFLLFAALSVFLSLKILRYFKSQKFPM